VNDVVDSMIDARCLLSTRPGQASTYVTKRAYAYAVDDEEVSKVYK